MGLGFEGRPAGRPAAGTGWLLHLAVASMILMGLPAAASGGGSFERTAAVGLESGEDVPISAVIDPAGNSAYFGTNTSPGRVVKIDLATMTRVDAVTLAAGEGFLWSAIIGSSGTHAYFGTCTNPGRVIEVELATMTRTRSVTLASGDNCLVSAVTDGDHGYFGTDSNPGRVVKVDLATMTRVGAIDLESGENQLKAAVIDPDGTYAYFGTDNTAPARVIKVRLAGATCAGGVACGGMGRVEGLTLNSGEIRLRSAVIDPDGTHAYFGTDTSPGRVVKVELEGMTRVGAIELDADEDQLFSAVSDGTSAYFGALTAPGRIVKVGLGGSVSAPAGSFDLGVSDSAPTVDGGGALAVGATLRAPDVTWTGAPTALRWKWQSCLDTMNVPGSCLEVTTSVPTLEVIESLVGRRVRVQPIAENSAGETVLSSVFTDGTVTGAASLVAVADVETALCAGGGTEVALTTDITDASSVLTVVAGCTATLDLNGRTLEVQRVVLGAGSTLTVRDTAGDDDGHLVAVGAVLGAAGIRTATGATLRIESGTVTATGGASSAGIGGSLAEPDGGTIEISGGSVTATGGLSGAGIGGGNAGAAGTITITGGEVDATAGSGAAAIGGGPGGDGGIIVITGGTVEATGTGLDPIGPGRSGAPGTLTIGTGGVRCEAGLTSSIAFDADPADCPSSGPSDLGSDPEVEGGTHGDGMTTESATPEPSPSEPGALLGCAPSFVRPGTTVTCTVTGGPPGASMDWNAAVNPVIAAGTLTLDADGNGSIEFLVPDAAAGRRIVVALTGTSTSFVLSAAEGPVPRSIPAGEGPAGPPPLLAQLAAGALLLLMGISRLALAPRRR